MLTGLNAKIDEPWMIQVWDAMALKKIISDEIEWIDNLRPSVWYFSFAAGTHASLRMIHNARVITRAERSGHRGSVLDARLLHSCTTTYMYCQTIATASSICLNQLDKQIILDRSLGANGCRLPNSEGVPA